MYGEIPLCEASGFSYFRLLQRNVGEQISNGAKKWSRANEEAWQGKVSRGWERWAGGGSCRMQNEGGQHGKRGVVDESGL